MKNSFTKEQKFTFVILYIIIVCCSLLDAKYHFNFFRYPFELILYPLQGVEQQGRTLMNSPQSTVNNLMNSQKIIEDLQLKNAALISQQGEAVFLKKENDELRLELEKSSLESPPKVFGRTGHIISLGPVSYIDQGSREGVQAQDLVMVQGILLGKIKEASHFFSSAQFFHEGAWEVVAKTETGVKGIIKGENNKIYFTQVPSDKKLEKDQILVTEGSVSELIPPGLVIGKLEQVIQDSGQPFQTAVISQAVDLSSLSTVQITRW